MKKKKITYGVSGMMEYQAVIKVGNKNVSINFSDGSMSAMGTNPATFTTDNIIIQNAIEASNDYKRGRIAIVNTIVLDEDLPIVRNHPETNISGEGSQDRTENHQETNSATNQAHPETNISGEGSQEEVEVIEVEFSCNDDAKDYLEQNFGHVRSKLRNREDIVAAGKAHGVDIHFV